MTAWRRGLASPGLGGSFPLGEHGSGLPPGSCSLRPMDALVFLRVQANLPPGFLMTLLGPLVASGGIFYLPGKDLMLRQIFFIFSQLGKPNCLGGSRQNGFPSLDFVPTPLGHLVSLGNSCCCFGHGQKTKGHVSGRWLAGLMLAVSVCLRSPVDCAVACEIVCSLHGAFYN